MFWVSESTLQIPGYFSVRYSWALLPLHFTTESVSLSCFFKQWNHRQSWVGQMCDCDVQCVYMCARMCVHVFTHAYVCVHMHVHVCANVCMCACACVCVCVCVCVCMLETVGVQERERLQIPLLVFCNQERVRERLQIPLLIFCNQERETRGSGGRHHRHTISTSF